MLQRFLLSSGSLRLAPGPVGWMHEKNLLVHMHWHEMSLLDQSNLLECIDNSYIEINYHYNDIFAQQLTEGVDMLLSVLIRFWLANKRDLSIFPVGRFVL